MRLYGFFFCASPLSSSPAYLPMHAPFPPRGPNCLIFFAFFFLYSMSTTQGDRLRRLGLGAGDVVAGRRGSLHQVTVDKNLQAFERWLEQQRGYDWKVKGDAGFVAGKALEKYLELYLAELKRCGDFETQKALHALHVGTLAQGRQVASKAQKVAAVASAVVEGGEDDEEEEEEEEEEGGEEDGGDDAEAVLIAGGMESTWSKFTLNKAVLLTFRFLWDKYTGSRNGSIDASA